MNVVFDEASEAYQPEIVVELQSESMEHLRGNVDRIVAWINNWREDQGQRDVRQRDNEEEQLKSR